MSTLKNALCLLAILIAYGVAGRMDYDDAVMLEDVQRSTATAECASSKALEPDAPTAQTTAPVHGAMDTSQRELLCPSETL